jgi:hypothetical protein
MLCSNFNHIIMQLITFPKRYPNRIELVFHTENSMKYRSLHTILKYRFNIPNFIFHVQNIGISYRNGMLKRYLRIVCKDRYFILFRYEILRSNLHITTFQGTRKKIYIRRESIYGKSIFKKSFSG